MLKIFIFLCLMIPICFLENFYWMVQLLFLLISFIFLLMSNKYNYFSMISYFLGCDIMSYGLLLLSFWIISLMLMASEMIYKNKNYYKLFLLNNLFLLIFLFLTFSSMNLFLFYFFFESSLVPTLFLILGWGYQPERIQAGLYLLFYTLLVSLPMLIGIIYINFLIKSLNFYLIYNYQFINEFLYYSLLMAFLVKMPMFLVHLWLPKAHVEAPIAGSMILAGVMLKLGGYGLLRVMCMFQLIGMKLNFLWVSISLVGSILVSLMCLRQIDLKSLIAYSSVAHMSMVLMGIMTMFYSGFCGSYLMMIGHGLCSSGMFCLMNINYERLNSRSLFINKGMINFMPTMSLWWFLLISVNMSAPPSLNLLSEILLINSMVCWSWWTMIFISFLSFFSASYSLYLYSYSQHGLMYSGLFSFSMASIREYLLLLLHWLPLNFLILKSDLLLLWL
uniref:NADH-ubiquinone oxidoreductase chain 4 n=1 Tax=Paratrichobius longicrus TaxID=402416 RepID=A0A5B9RFN2_9MUSC|nr:NADH dehydrogenase subunit 4 [Paratrichobius longicrus]QEG77652.1 NADH dehydrogenase subunit 4 [Paratrichobius longicrus]